MTYTEIGYHNALKRIIELYGKINKNSDLFTSEVKVMSEYQKLFSPSNIKNIKADDFIEFLHFKNNHHWTSLDRQAKNLTSDIGALRTALSELHNDSKPIRDRIDNMTPVKGLGMGIYTPILMIASNQKFAVLNSKSEGFLVRYGINPDKKGKTPGKYYEEANDIFNRLAKDSKLDLWTLDALYHYDLYIKEIPTEIQRRKKLWDSLVKDPDGNVSLSELSRAKLRMGQREILSKKVPKLDERVALSILTTGTRYNDIIEEDGLTYDFPQTAMRQQDENEIEGMISAMHYQVPIFVIIGSKKDGKSRKVKIGLVRDYDTHLKTFLVDLFNHWPDENDLDFKTQDEQEAKFDPYNHKGGKKAFIETRPEQAKFKFNVLKRYGAECAVCKVNIREILEAAHIVPKSASGSNQSPNGLVLCANHHRMFDNNLFTINADLKLEFREGYKKDDLMIKVEDLSHLSNKPNIDAIKIRYKMFKT